MGKNNELYNRMPEIVYKIGGLTEKIKDITTRFKLTYGVEYTTDFFDQYYIEEFKRPDQIALDLYEDVNLSWMITYFNNITDLYAEFPLSNKDLTDHLNLKYAQEIKKREEEIVLEKELDEKEKLRISIEIQNLKIEQENLRTVVSKAEEINAIIKEIESYIFQRVTINTPQVQNYVDLMGDFEASKESKLRELGLENDEAFRVLETYDVDIDKINSYEVIKNEITKNLLSINNMTTKIEKLQAEYDLHIRSMVVSKFNPDVFLVNYPNIANKHDSFYTSNIDASVEERLIYSDEDLQKTLTYSVSFFKQLSGINESVIEIASYETDVVYRNSGESWIQIDRSNWLDTVSRLSYNVKTKIMFLKEGYTLIPIGSYNGKSVRENLSHSSVTDYIRRYTTLPSISEFKVSGDDFGNIERISTTCGYFSSVERSLTSEVSRVTDSLLKVISREHGSIMYNERRVYEAFVKIAMSISSGINFSNIIDDLSFVTDWFKDSGYTETGSMLSAIILFHLSVNDFLSASDLWNQPNKLITDAFTSATNTYSSEFEEIRSLKVTEQGYRNNLHNLERESVFLESIYNQFYSVENVRQSVKTINDNRVLIENTKKMLFKDTPDFNVTYQNAISTIDYIDETIKKKRSDLADMGYYNRAFDDYAEIQRKIEKLQMAFNLLSSKQYYGYLDETKYYIDQEGRVIYAEDNTMETSERLNTGEIRRVTIGGYEKYLNDQKRFILVVKPEHVYDILLMMKEESKIFKMLG